MRRLTRTSSNLLAHHNHDAYNSPDGFPQATIVYYVNDGLVLYFATESDIAEGEQHPTQREGVCGDVDEIDNSYKLRALSLSGIADRISGPGQVLELQIRLFQAVPQAKRFAPIDGKQIIVYSITRIAISLVDYAAGYGRTVLVEL